MPLIVVLGGINTDYVVRSRALPEPGQSVLGEPLLVGPGGKGANQAVVASRLGARVALLGCVGNEARGRELIRGLRRERIDARHVRRAAKTPSGAAIISVDASGEKQIAAGLGANLELKPAHIRAAGRLIAKARVLLLNFETPMDCALEAVRIAARHGVRIVLDPAPPTRIPAELLRWVFAIRPNADEAEQLTGVKVKDRGSARRAARALLKRGVKVVAMQAGEQGDLVISGEDEIFVPRLKVKTVDATGAGDAFAGALAVGIAECMSLEEAARFANAAAALATTKMGAQEGMPRRKDLERMLAKARSAQEPSRG